MHLLDVGCDTAWFNFVLEQAQAAR